MDPKKDTPDTPTNEQPAPSDALSRDPEDLEQEKLKQQTDDPAPAEPTGEKKQSPFIRLVKRLNIYFLLFILLLVIVGAITIVNYLNSQKPVDEAQIATQELTSDALKQLSNSNASIGASSQTLTIRGNATIEGQTLIRGNLSLAGNLQTAGTIQASGLTVAGSSKLDDTEVNSLQVSSNAAIQGDTSLRNLKVSGTTSLSGPVMASQLTVSRLILSGNAVLQIPNHLSFTGPTPGRSVGNALGGGGSTSVSGSDTSGSINIRTGNNPSAGCFTRISFAQSFASTPRVIVSPIGNAAGKAQYYVDRDSSGFSLCTASPAPANQTFGFDYFVAG